MSRGRKVGGGRWLPHSHLEYRLCNTELGKLEGVGSGEAPTFEYTYREWLFHHPALEEEGRGSVLWIRVHRLTVNPFHSLCAHIMFSQINGFLLCVLGTKSRHVKCVCFLKKYFYQLWLFFWRVSIWRSLCPHSWSGFSPLCFKPSYSNMTF